MKNVPKSPERLAILEKIAQYEREGRFDEDVENDPPSRVLLPEEIAYAVAFLVNDEASWITGSNLDINGGHHMGW